mgnify:CR=1 FL=1
MDIYNGYIRYTNTNTKTNTNTNLGKWVCNKETSFQEFREIPFSRVKGS